MRTFYNDIDPYCCAVLRKQIALGNLPEGDVDERDIRELSATDLVGYAHVHLFAGIGGLSSSSQGSGNVSCRLPFSGINNQFINTDTQSGCQPLQDDGARHGKLARLNTRDSDTRDMRLCCQVSNSFISSLAPVFELDSQVALIFHRKPPDRTSFFYGKTKLTEKQYFSVIPCTYVSYVLQLCYLEQVTHLQEGMLIMYRNEFTDEELRECYINKKMSIRQTAAYLHVKIKRIRQRMQEIGMEPRNRHEVGKVAAEKAMARPDYIPVGTRAAGKPRKHPEREYPFTREQLYDCYVNQEMTQKEIAERFGVTQKAIWIAMLKMSIPSRIAMKRNQFREKNDYWKGGRTLKERGIAYHPLLRKSIDIYGQRQGYWMIKMDGHPLADKRGYVYEHILNALEAAGLETMPEGCCVHHIDCDSQNNDPDNLQICTRSDHAAYHATLETLIKPLMERGIVGFDPERGYILL